MAEVRKHGRSGYRRGCKCGICRAGHSEAAREYRARKKRETDAARDAEAPTPPPAQPVSGDVEARIDFNAAPGEIETALTSELEKMIGEPPFKQTLFVLARYNARILDQLPAIERPDLASGLQSRLFDVFDRLRKVEAGTRVGVPADLSGLLGPDDS